MVAKVFIQSHGVNAVSSTIFTFPTVQIGTGWVVVEADAVNASAIATVTAMTIGGVSAVNIARGTSAPAGAFTTVEMWGATSAAQTGTIVVTWSASQLQTGYGAWSTVGANTTAFTTAVNTASPPHVSLNVPTDGIVIAAIENTSGNSTNTFSGVSTDFTELVGGATNHSGGVATTSNPITPLTVTATFTGTAVCLLVASFSASPVPQFFDVLMI